MTSHRTPALTPHHGPIFRRAFSSFANITWLLVAIVTIGYLAALALDVTPYLRGPAPMNVEWRWRRYEMPPYNRLWSPLLALLLYLALIAWMEQLDLWTLRQRHRVLLLVALMVAALIVQASVLHLVRPNVVTLLFERNVSHAADGYYTAALQIEEPGEFLRSFPDRMPTFVGDHPRTHPPGFALLHWVLGRTVGRWAPLRTWVRWRACPILRVNGRDAKQLTSALIVSLATPLLSTLALVPAYALGCRRGDLRSGFRAAATLALVPAFLLFAPQMDQLFPLITGLILWTLAVGWERRTPGWFLLSGLILSLATFLSLGLAGLALWLGVYVLVRWLQDHARWTPVRLVLCGAAFALGAASVWAIGWIAFGLDFIAVFRTGMAQHFEIITAQRSYRLWVWYNLYDFAAFLGLPLALWFLTQALPSLWHAVRLRWSRVDAVAVATVLTIFILDLSGTSRGEVPRLWLFLVPPIVLAAVTTPRSRRRYVGLASLQAACTLVFALFLYTVPILPLPALERTRQPIWPTQQAVSATFDDQIELLGYELAPIPAHPGQNLDLSLHWRSLSEPQQRYKVFVHILDATGTTRAQVDGAPVDWTLPTTCWVAGEVISDRYTVALPPDLLPGNYALALGLYSESTGLRLPVTGSSHPVGEQPHILLFSDHVRVDPLAVAAQP